MEPSARIERMEQAGILSASQAARLRESLEAQGPVTVPPRKRSFAVAAAMSLGLIVVVALLWTLGAGDGTDVIEDVSQSINQPGASGMYKSFSMVLAVALLLLVPLLTWAWLHNDLVTKEESTYSAWAQVESNYQRRSDLIPALVETVARYLRHEAETLTNVTSERSAAVAPLDKAVEELVEAQKLSAEQLQALAGKPPSEEAELEALGRAQDEVGLGMRRLLAIAESYPSLRSADQFLELQAQLEGTENRINVSRMRFNEVVRDYNGALRKLPGSLVANVAGLRRKAYFKSDEGSRDAKPLGLD